MNEWVDDMRNRNEEKDKKNNGTRKRQEQ